MLGLLQKNIDTPVTRSIKLFLRWLRTYRIHYTPLVEVTLYKQHLLSNYHEYVKRYPARRCAPVLKSNAYGHGLLEIATMLDGIGAPFFIIDSYFEALMLRRNGIRTPLCVIGYTPRETMQRTPLRDVAFTISDIQQLRECSAHLRRHTSLHLKIDTGMHRQGINHCELGEALSLIRSNRLLHLEGCCTHFADADTSESVLTKKQIDLWNRCVSQIQTLYPDPLFFHAAATAGSRWSLHINANIIRLGIGLYGIDPYTPLSPHLSPVLEMRTRINAVYEVRSGESVGYNGTYVVKNDMRIAPIPVGYYEGLDRRLSNKGVCLVEGIECPIVGRVSMNMTTLDISRVPKATPGMEVVVMSHDRTQKNSIEHIAVLCNTIPYDILVHIPQHLRRVVI